MASGLLKKKKDPKDSLYASPSYKWAAWMLATYKYLGDRGYEINSFMRSSDAKALKKFYRAYIEKNGLPDELGILSAPKRAS